LAASRGVLPQPVEIDPKNLGLDFFDLLLKPVKIDVAYARAVRARRRAARKARRPEAKTRHKPT
jgi:hypothetical protein